MSQIILKSSFDWKNLIFSLIVILFVAIGIAFIINIIQLLLHKKTTFFLSMLSFIIIGCLVLAAYIINIFNIQNFVLHCQNEYTTQQIQKKAKTKVDRDQIKMMVMRDQNKNDDFKKVGFVSIPSRSILLPIYNDAYSNDGLNLGADYANRYYKDPDGKNLPVMGQGNYGLAAHNFNDGKTGFSGLQKNLNTDAPYFVHGKLGESDWLDGKFVYLANQKGIYQYKIVNQIAKDEKDSDVLIPTKHAKLTIISCLFPSTSKRIITQAKLINNYSWRKAPKKIVGYFNLKVQNTNARADWFNPGIEEGANGDAGGTKLIKK